MALDLKKVVFLLTFLLSESPIIAMERFHEPVQITQIETSTPPQIALAQIAGIPDEYKTSVCQDDLHKANNLLQEKAISYFQHRAHEINLKTLEKEVFSSWIPALNKYMELYHRLEKNFRGTMRHQKKEAFFNTLFDFVSNFESLYQMLKEGHLNHNEPCDYLETEIFPIYQKTWNLYMKAYEHMFNTKTSFFGDFNFTKLHDRCLKHLFYTRDSRGYLLFTIYPHEPIENDLYITYLCYGIRDEPLFWSREVIFRLTSESKVLPITSPGFLIRNTDNIYSIELYRGDYGPVPYSLTKALTSRLDWLKDHQSLSSFFSTPQNEGHQQSDICLPFEYKHGTEVDIQCSLQMSQHITYILKTLLNGQQKVFIAQPATPIEHVEADYLFLTQLRQNLLLGQQDPDTLYSYTLIQEEFSCQNIDEIIAHYEEQLENLYQNDEQEKIEIDIRRQQEERRQMVANGSHYQQKQNRKKRHPHNKKFTQMSIGKKHQLESIEDHQAKNLKMNARSRAQQRLQKFKEQISSSSKVKFRSYVQMVNTMTQELRKLNTQVTGQLHGGSHGAMTIDKEKLPLFRPHKGSDKSIGTRSAQGILGRLTQRYFHTLSLSQSDAKSA